MNTDTDPTSRRGFLTDVGRMASAAAIAGWAPPSLTQGDSPVQSADWDLRWIDRLRPATDRAVFDWPSLGDPADAIVLQLAERYLDNCQAAYAGTRYEVRVVLNIRTQATVAAMNDQLWERYSLGTEYNTKDPTTQQPATRNPFWYRAPSPAPGITLPTLADLVGRGAIVLVCDFAIGHLSKRLATKLGRNADEIHADLLANLIQGAYAVPSGIFGLARAQNAGCALVRT